MYMLFRGTWLTWNLMVMFLILEITCLQLSRLVVSLLVLLRTKGQEIRMDNIIPDMGSSTESSASSTSTIRSTFFKHLQNFYFQALEKYSKHHNTSTFYRLVVLAIEGKLAIFYQYNSTTEHATTNSITSFCSESTTHFSDIIIPHCKKITENPPYYTCIITGCHVKILPFSQCAQTLNNSYQHSPT